MTELRNDSIALAKVFSAVRDEIGVGGYRRGSSTVGFSSDTPTLADDILAALPRASRVLRRAIELHPVSAYQAYYRLRINGKANLGEQLQSYLYDIPGRTKYWEAFRKASILARHFGDAFILMGVNDGQLPNKPIKYDRIKSIDRLILCEKNQILPKGGNPPEYYEIQDFTGSGIPKSEQVWHHSRVLRFFGDEVLDAYTLSINRGYNDSILQSMFSAWIQWEEAIASSASMIRDYDVSTFGIKGLARAIADDAAKGVNTNQSAVFQRLVTLMSGKSVTRGVVYDLENEKLDQVQRRYQGADLIVNALQDRLAAASDIPANKLFNRLPQTGLSTGVQAAQIVRSEWAIANNEWTERSIRPQLEALISVAIVAQDAPTRGVYNPWEIEFPLNIPLSTLERLELEKATAERDRLNIESGIYSPQEARQQYQVPEQTYVIQVGGSTVTNQVSWSVSVRDQSDPIVVEAPSRSAAIGEVKRNDPTAVIVSARRLDSDSPLTDDQWDSLSTISDQDLERFANDAIDPKRIS